MAVAEFYYRKLLASGAAVDLALAVAAVLKATEESEEEGHWVTIEGRPVFIRGPWPEVELLPVTRDEKAINYQNVLRNGKAVERAALQRSPSLARAMRNMSKLQRQRDELSKRLDQVGEEYGQLVQQYPLDHPLVQENQKRFDQLMAQERELAKQMSNAKKELYALDGEYIKALNSALGKAEPANFDDHVTENREQIEAAKDWISNVVGKVSDKPCGIKQLKPGEGYYGDSRSYYMSGQNTMYLVSRAGGTTVIHEWGHYVEEVRPTVNHACVEFLYRRYQQAVQSGRAREFELKPLKSIISSNAYHPDEVAFRDRFREPYVGKLYDRGQATEVFSMGLQYLYEDPLRFRETDPEHYYLTLGLIAYLRKNPVDSIKHPPQRAASGPWAKLSQSRP
jgi:hypothetical protein